MKLLHSDASPKSIAYLLNVVFGLWLISILVHQFQVLAYLPVTCFQSDNFISQMVPADLNNRILFFAFLKLLLILSIIGIIMRKFLKVNLALTCVLLTVYCVTIYCSRDTAGHQHIALLFVTYLLALYAWVDDFGIKHNPKQFPMNSSQFQLLSMALVLCVTYSLIGIRRMVYSGETLLTSDDMFNLIMRDNLIPDTYFFNWHIAEAVLTHEWLKGLVKFLLSVVTLFEILAPIAIISSKFRYAFLCVMIVFHIGSVLFVSDLFLENLVLFILLIDFKYWPFHKDYPK